MPEAKAPRKAAADKAAAAAAEVTDEPRTVESHGLTLTLPAEVPPAILMDMVELETVEEVDGYFVSLRILRSIVGQDQFIDVRHRIGDDPEKVMDLLNDVLDTFGLSMGESSASPDS